MELPSTQMHSPGAGSKPSITITDISAAPYYTGQLYSIKVTIAPGTGTYANVDIGTTLTFKPDELAVGLIIVPGQSNKVTIPPDRSKPLQIDYSFMIQGILRARPSWNVTSDGKGDGALSAKHTLTDQPEEAGAPIVPMPVKLLAGNVAAPSPGAGLSLVSTVTDTSGGAITGTVFVGILHRDKSGPNFSMQDLAVSWKDDAGAWQPATSASMYGQDVVVFRSNKNGKFDVDISAAANTGNRNTWSSLIFAAGLDSSRDINLVITNGTVDPESDLEEPVIDEAYDEVVDPSQFAACTVRIPTNLKVPRNTPVLLRLNGKFQADAVSRRYDPGSTTFSLSTTDKRLHEVPLGGTLTPGKVNRLEYVLLDSGYGLLASRNCTFYCQPSSTTVAPFGPTEPGTTGWNPPVIQELAGGGLLNGITISEANGIHVSATPAAGAAWPKTGQTIIFTLWLSGYAEGGSTPKTDKPFKQIQLTDGQTTIGTVFDAGDFAGYGPPLNDGNILPVLHVQYKVTDAAGTVIGTSPAVRAEFDTIPAGE